MNEPVILITGASRGLGAALAREWASRGARLLLTARSETPLRLLVDELSRSTDALFGALDVTDDNGMREFIARGIREFGRIDVLVNNASALGGSPMPRLEDLTPAAFFEVMETNVRAPLAMAQCVIPDMRARGSGAIVNVTSDAAVAAYSGWGAYGTSKAALEHLSRILATELDGSGITVMVVDPGNMDTQMHRDAEPGEDLTDLPKPEAIAPGFVELVTRAVSGRESYARYEVQNVPAGV
jgi:NAD(P)-dependent dehydrogenase (short-subunit alcohol dehydrogenase family)